MQAGCFEERLLPSLHPLTAMHPPMPASCFLGTMQPAAKASQASAHLDSVQRALAAAQRQLPPLQQALAVEQKHVS